MLGALKLRVRHMAERRGGHSASNTFSEAAWRGKPGTAELVQRLKPQFTNTVARHVNVLPLLNGCSEVVVHNVIAAGTAIVPPQSTVCDHHAVETGETQRESGDLEVGCSAQWLPVLIQQAS